MTGAPRIPEAEITGLYGWMVKRYSKKKFGTVPSTVRVAWHHKPVFKFSMGIGRETRRWQECDENLKSFAHMAVASLVGCSFCLDLGCFMAHDEGLDVTKAREVPRWRESDIFTSLERDVMEYAEAMSRTPPTVTDELSARLLGALGTRAFIELAAWIAVANFYTRSNIALGVEAQGLADSCGLDPLTQASAADRSG